MFVLLTAGLFGVKTASASIVPIRPAHILPQAKATDAKQKTAQGKNAAEALPLPDAAAQPASVTLKNGTLTVSAHNSSLNQILKDVATLGGMTLDGTTGNERIFGAYGPGSPREVLTSLLTGSGYNFIMVGDKPDGVPRKLLLTAENTAAPSTIAHSARAAASPHPDSPAEDTVDEEPPGPGAIIHVPPAGPEDPQERARQNLERLTHMREQQQNKPQQ